MDFGLFQKFLHKNFPAHFFCKPSAKSVLYFHQLWCNKVIVIHLGMHGLPNTQSTRLRLVVCGTSRTRLHLVGYELVILATSMYNRSAISFNHTHSLNFKFQYHTIINDYVQ